MQRELCKRAALLSLLGLFAIAAGESPGPVMPLVEVERGLEGRGWSVFAGGEPEPFDVEVLGVWRNVSPDTSYILARLSGQRLEETGVIAGMSGSPVYVGERLLGAVAFSWAFATDAIAGITPIEQMRRMAGEPRLPAQPADPMATPLQDLLDPPDARERLRTELSALHPATETSSGLLWTSVGLGPDTRALLGEAVGSVVGAGGTGELQSDLRPGDAVAAVLIDGDLRLAATGTVTDRLGDSVLAFGHPFLSMGDVLVPMAAAEILAVVPSLANSFKIGNVGQTLGSFDRDRPSGIRGTMGLEAPTLPMTVRIEASTRRAFEIRVARIPAVAGSLVATALLGSIDAAVGMGGQQSLEMSARIGIADRPPLVIRQTFDGASASLDAAVHMLNIVGFLVNNSFAELDVTDIDVDLVKVAGPRVTRVVSAYPDRRIVSPGETLRLTVDLEPYRGDARRHSLDLDLPADLDPGRYMILVGDGTSIDGVKLELEKTAPTRIDQALELLDGLHSRSELAVLGVVAAPGLVVDGEPLPRLPGSIQALWSGVGGRATRLATAIRQEQVEDLGVPLSGLVRVDLEVKAEGSR
jgi:hypothetical protein